MTVLLQYAVISLVPVEDFGDEQDEICARFQWLTQSLEIVPEANLHFEQEPCDIVFVDELSRIDIEAAHMKLKTDFPGLNVVFHIYPVEDSPAHDFIVELCNQLSLARQGVKFHLLMSSYQHADDTPENIISNMAYNLARRVHASISRALRQQYQMPMNLINQQHFQSRQSINIRPPDSPASTELAMNVYGGSRSFASNFSPPKMRRGADIQIHAMVTPAPALANQIATGMGQHDIFCSAPLTGGHKCGFSASSHMIPVANHHCMACHASMITQQPAVATSQQAPMMFAGGSSGVCGNSGCQVTQRRVFAKQVAASFEDQSASTSHLSPPTGQRTAVLRGGFNETASYDPYGDDETGGRIPQYHCQQHEARSRYFQHNDRMRAKKGVNGGLPDDVFDDRPSLFDLPMPSQRVPASRRNNQFRQFASYVQRPMHHAGGGNQRVSPAAVNEECQLLVANFPADTNEYRLAGLFSREYEVQNCEIVTLRSGQTVGIVTMRTKFEVMQAVEQKNGKTEEFTDESTVLLCSPVADSLREEGTEAPPEVMEYKQYMLKHADFARRSVHDRLGFRHNPYTTNVRNHRYKHSANRY